MKVLGVLRGGHDKYEESLREGGEALSFISEHLSDEYKPVDILIDKSGVWHMGGVPIQPASLMHKIDTAWNTGHHSFTQILRNFSIPTLAEPLSFQIMRNSREMLKEHMQKIGIKLPRHFIIPKYQPDIDGPVVEFAYQKAGEVFQKFGAPWVIRSYPPQKDMGVHVATTFKALIHGILDAVIHESSIEIEEMISDRTAEIHSISGFRNEDVYTLSVSGLNKEEKEKIKDLAKNLHTHLEAPHYLYAKVYLHPKRGVFLSHARFMPELHSGASIHKAGELIGIKTKHIMSHILGRAK